MRKIHKNKLYVITAIIIILVLLHMEFIINQKYAPENVLIQVKTQEGLPEKNAECFADISSLEFNEEKIQLIKLENIYDFIEARTFSLNQEKGFHLLETGFFNYKKDFDIRIVCYSENLRGVSYTIVNNTNTAECEIKDNGKLLLC